MSTLQATLDELLDTYSFDYSVLDHSPEAQSVDGLRETAAFIGEQVTGVVGMLVLSGMIGPEEFEEGMRNYGAACLIAGIRTGQALAVAALDDVQSDLDSLDDVDSFPWEE